MTRDIHPGDIITLLDLVQHMEREDEYIYRILYFGESREAIVVETAANKGV